MVQILAFLANVSQFSNPNLDKSLQESGTVHAVFKCVAESKGNSMAQTRAIQFAERIFGSKPHTEVASASIS